MIKANPHVVDTAHIRQNWIPNEDFACMVLNAAHLILPYGELWMCRLFHQSIPRITNEKLLSDVKAFIAQEGNHAKAHRSVMNEFAAQGSDFSISHRLLTKTFSVTFGEKLFGRWQVSGNWVLRWLRWRIGIVAVLEHITCMLGGWLVENTAFQQAGADENMIQLFKWHGAEEVEHRSVAHDLHNHLGGNQLFRIGIYLPMAFLVIYTWMRATQRFINDQYAGQRRFGLRDYIAASRKGLLPTFTFLLMSGLSYLRLNFNPETHIREETIAACDAFIGSYQKSIAPDTIDAL